MTKIAPIVALVALWGGPLGAASRLDLRIESLPLPGAPASVVPADVDGDGRVDLAVVVVFTRWEQTETIEYTEMDDIEGLVEVMTIVPSLDDRRELRIYLARDGGGYELAGPATELSLDVISIMAGPPGLPLVALTDDGLASIELDVAGSARFEPRLRRRPVLAGTGVFMPDLRLVVDLTGDGVDDLLLPAVDGVELWPGTGDGLAPEPRWRIRSPGDELVNRNGRLVRRYPLPEIRDLSGDGLPDLVWRDPIEGWNEATVQLADGDGEFGPPIGVGLVGRTDAEEYSIPIGVDVATRLADNEYVVHVGDLDGDGRAEVTTQEVLELEEDGMRAEIRDAEAPSNVFRAYRLDEEMAAASEPYSVLEAKGYAFETDEDDDIQLPGGYFDVNADGRQDLVTITLQISVTKMLGALATKRISLPIDFHVWCRGEDDRLTPVAGLDLSGKIKVNLNDLKLRSLPMFAGDFDGDERLDYVQVGRGRTMGIHTGQADCSFPRRPDLSVRLRAEPAHVGLVRILDLDGDDRSDVMVVQPGSSTEAGVTAPVVLDLYLSGGPS